MGMALQAFDRAGGAEARTTARATGVRWPIALACFFLACWAGWSIPLNNDVSWQYWVARQIRGGAVFYRDIVEVNPPLWFWEAVPISALADRLHVDAAHLVIVSVMARALLAVLMMAKLIEDEGAPRAGPMLVGLALLLCLLPLHDFAEREHLMLIGALPYTALLAHRRAPERPIPARFAAIVGAFAAYGFAMKPHFALVPLALEVWLALGLRRSWRPFRPETIAVALVAGAYLAAILLFAPDYMRSTVPLARAAYGAFSPPFSWLVLHQLWAPTWLLALLALATAHRSLPADARAALVTASALAVIYFVQGKGFPYHAIPLTAALGWALWLTIVQDGDVLRAMIRRPLAALALVLLGATGFAFGSFTPYRAGAATTALERLPAGSNVAIVSAHSWLAFPLIEDRRFVWPMRNIALWTIPEIARHGEGPAATPAGLLVRRTTLDMIAADLWCHPPAEILFDDPAASPALRGTRFSYEAFVRSDPRLRDLLGRYRRSVSDGGATLYLRTGDIAPRGDACRPILIRPDFA